jgi:hypothetical protein
MKKNSRLFDPPLGFNQIVKALLLVSSAFLLPDQWLAKNIDNVAIPG